jgi:hypothetical protein
MRAPASNLAQGRRCRQARTHISVAEGGDECFYCSLISDVPQRLESREADAMAIVPERGDHWFDRSRVADLAQRLNGTLAQQ